jgi:hypothetical protein
MPHSGAQVAQTFRASAEGLIAPDIQVDSLRPVTLDAGQTYDETISSRT